MLLLISLPIVGCAMLLALHAAWAVRREQLPTAGRISAPLLTGRHLTPRGAKFRRRALVAIALILAIVTLNVAATLIAG